MKKQLIFTLALFVTLSSFAQKKELKTLEKAVKNNNFAEAKVAATQLESMLDSMDDKMKSKFYFARAKALYANGTGAIADFETAFDDFTKVDKKYVSDLSATKKSVQKELLIKVTDLYTGSKYIEASSLFAMLYKLVPEDQTYLYNAAVSARQGEDFDSALKHYIALKDVAYTGVSKEYFAVNKETGEEEVFDIKTRDLYVKTVKSHISPGERMTESKAAEIAKMIALIYVRQGKSELALEAMKEARTADPSNTDLIINEANIHFELGNTEAYGVLIKEAVENDPNNQSLLFNLGIISAKSGKVAEAKEYYKKVISLDVNHILASTNLAALILDEDKSIMKKMNELTNSNADTILYNKLQEDRKLVYKEAIPYLENVINSGKAHEDIAKTLSSLYSALDQNDKAKALKAKFGL